MHNKISYKRSGMIIFTKFIQLIIIYIESPNDLIISLKKMYYELNSIEIARNIAYFYKKCNKKKIGPKDIK